MVLKRKIDFLNHFLVFPLAIALRGDAATCYYKETVEDMYGDLHENIVKWDAECVS